MLAPFLRPVSSQNLRSRAEQQSELAVLAGLAFQKYGPGLHSLKANTVHTEKLHTSTGTSGL